MNSTLQYHDVIMEKMSRVVHQATDKTRKTSERYLSLCNRQLHIEWEKTKNFGILGGSLAIRQHWEQKFRVFIPRDEPVTREPTKVR